MRHILGLLVEDRPGVMQRISGLFSRRGFNIETITVGKTEKEGISRMTLSIIGDEKTVEQVIKQVYKLVEVIKIIKLREGKSVVRELCLVKVKTDKKRSQIIDYVNIFRGRIVDASLDDLTIEITGDSNKVNAFLDLMKNFGIKEICRTGITAIARGAKPIEMKK
jgi:acetolactate synthase-1/3 small subunit